MDIQKLSPTARAYYESLTPGMKESIQQTAVEMSTVNDLERFVQNTLSNLPAPEAKK